MIDDYVGGYSPIEQENIELECQVDRLTEENEQLKQQVSYLEDNLRVARKDREELQDVITNKLEEFLKEKPHTSLRFLANKKLKEEYEQKIADINKGWNELVNGWVVDYKELEEENKQLTNEHNSLVIEHERLDYLYGQQTDEINNLFKENERLKQQIEKQRCCSNCKHVNKHYQINGICDSCFGYDKWELEDENN